MSYSFDLEDPAKKNAAEDSDSDDEEEEGKFYKGMVPMADMLNADADRNNVGHLQLNINIHHHHIAVANRIIIYSVASSKPPQH